MNASNASQETFASFVRAMGRGPSRGRSLVRAEAAEAMRQILDGEAAPEAVGALLMLMRYRGETAEEVAGFVDGMRRGTSAWEALDADLDWPSYAAGRSRGLPWFLLSAKLVARSGVKVVVHGWNSHQHSSAGVRNAARRVGVPIVGSLEAAQAKMRRAGVVYAPIEAIDDRLLAWLQLREVLGLRSAVNTCLRVLNPAAAAASVQGVFHPPYRTLQQEAGALLEQKDLLVLKGGGGEFERHPSKSVALFGLRDGAPFETVAPALVDQSRRLADEGPNPRRLEALWFGRLDDPFAEAVVVGTAALVLLACGRVRDLRSADAVVRELWRDRAVSHAA